MHRRPSSKARASLRPPTVRGEVEISQVHFRYRPESSQTIPSLAVSSTATDVPTTRHSWRSRRVPACSAGSMTALVRPSGAGKTTLSHLIRRLYDPILGSSGSTDDIREFDTGPSLASWRSYQESHFFHESVRDNLRSPTGATDAELRVSVPHRRDRRPHCGLLDGYGHRRRRGRIPFSAASSTPRPGPDRSCATPAIVILDEATAHLDTTSERPSAASR